MLSPPTAGGTITFSINGVDQTPIKVVNGAAKFTTNQLFVGSHYILAKYSGDNKFSPSTSKQLVQKINSDLTGVWNGKYITKVSLCTWTTTVTFNLNQIDDYHAQGTMTVGSTPDSSNGKNTCLGNPGYTKNVSFSGKISAKSFNMEDRTLGIKISGKFSPSSMSGKVPVCFAKACPIAEFTASK